MFIKSQRENVKNTNLNQATVNDLVIVEQNNLISQLLQEIDEMRLEMYKTRYLKKFSIIAKAPTLDNGRPPLHFPSSDPTSEHFPSNSKTFHH